MAGERLLVVDDYEDTRTAYGEYLRIVGYDVTIAEDGDAALMCALRGTCDLIVLDVALPKLDGLEVLRLLRSNSITKNVPVIVLSALSGQHVRAQALTAGANLFLTKPCSPDELEGAIRRVLTDRAASR